MSALSIAYAPSFSFDDEPTVYDARPWHRPQLEVVADEDPTTMLAAPVRRQKATERIEALSLPEGLREEMLPIGATPTSPEETRIWMIRMARDLGREYRIQYGVELRTDASAIERMQWHLASFVQRLGGRDEKGLARELVRHGMLLGEILARALGGAWLDLSDDRPGKWEVFVPPMATVSPIVRVRRFVQQGMTETDLVALFLELDAAQRGLR
jgi:hypothetical protein